MFSSEHKSKREPVAEPSMLHWLLQVLGGREQLSAGSTKTNRAGASARGLGPSFNSLEAKKIAGRFEANT